MKATVLSLDALQAAVDRLPDNRLAPARRAALDALRKSGLPTMRHEEYKYTDLSHVIDISNRWLDGEHVETPATSTSVDEASTQIDADWLVFRNGQVDASALDVAGVSITRLGDTGLEQTATTELGNLNTALLADGLQITIAANARLERPIGLLIADYASVTAGVAQLRVDIVVEESASAGFVEFHTSGGDADHYGNTVINLSVGDNATVEYLRLQERSLEHSQTTRLSVNVGRDSTFSHAAFDLGGKLVRNDLDIRLVEPGAHAAINGLYLVGDGQHIDNHTRVDHVVGPAASRQEYRGILTGRARGVWNGKAIVHEGADGTDAEQSNHNLLLSQNAEINAKPELEIYADDVKCSHGTTVGQLDKSAMFYLRTRGLSRHDARQVLTRAFAQAIVAKAPLKALHEVVAEKIAARLDALMLGAEE